MTDRELGCYGNNNNYMPSLQPPTFLPASPSVPFHSMPSSVFQNCNIGQGAMPTNFTFTTPTQGTAITYALPVYTAPVLGTQSFPQGPGAPGAGVQWQHSIPRQMPWNVTMPQNNSSVTVFTAQTLQPSVPSRLSVRFEPQASCSFTHRGPKRHHIGEDEMSCPLTKIRITDEKMAAKMQGLHITGPSGCSDTNQRGVSQSSSWQQLQHIEARLEEDVGDAEVCGDSKSESHLPRVHIKGGINAQDLLNPSSILPKKILNDLNKPCMQVVLWKPPGIIKSVEQMITKKGDSGDCSNENNTIDDTSSMEGSNSDGYCPQSPIHLPVPLFSQIEGYCAEKRDSQWTSSSSNDVDMDL